MAVPWLENLDQLFVQFNQNWANAVTAIATLAAILVAYRQLSAGVRTERARLARDLLNDIRQDDEVFEMFYRIEWNQFVYDPDRFPKSLDEKRLDSLLHQLDIICDCYFRKLLTARDMKFFNYFIERVMINGEVKKYLACLNEWHPGSGFPSLEEYSRPRHKISHALATLVPRLITSRRTTENSGDTIVN